MFKFDFNVEDSTSEIFKDANVQDKDELRNSTNTIEWLNAKEVVSSPDIIDHLDIAKLNSTEQIFGDIRITYMIAGCVLEYLKGIESNLNIGKAEEQHSDLIPGIYEGGAKVWECTDDLLQLISKKYTKNDWKSKQVLDLGCGAGLLGIYAIQCGAIVHFQDYNEDVLRQITIPNVLLNIKTSETETLKPGFVENVLQRYRFYAGDWEKYSELTKDDTKFDIILTSETIYNVENYKKLLDTFSSRLKPDGVVFLAAKTYYFGVGGCLRQFEELIKTDSRFTSELIWTSNHGVNREIIQIKFK